MDCIGILNLTVTNKLVTCFQNPSAKDIELSLRPASMVFKPKTPSLLPKSAMAKPGSADMDGRPGGPVMMQQKEANILIKQAPADTGKAAKKKAAAAAAQANKGPTREEVFAKVNSILDILFRYVLNYILTRNN